MFFPIPIVTLDSFMQLNFSILRLPLPPPCCQFFPQLQKKKKKNLKKKSRTPINFDSYGLKRSHNSIVSPLSMALMFLSLV